MSRSSMPLLRANRSVSCKPSTGRSRGLGSGQQSSLVADELEPGSFGPDRRRSAVPGEDTELVLETGEPDERCDHRVRVAAGQVDATPAGSEQRVAAEQEAL